MKLWLLKPVDTRTHWNPWFDKAFGFVVRAPDEATARDVAAEESGDEKPEPWLDKKFTDCVELTADGPAQVILRDFASA